MNHSEPQQIAPDAYVLTLGRTAAASNVYLVGSASSWLLVDTGWNTSARKITAAAESVFGVGTRPTAILLTHIHPDHSGAAGALARSWGVPVYVHPAELAMAAGTVDLNSVIGVLIRRERISPPPRYSTWDWSAAARSVATLAALEPQLLGPGHGQPLGSEAAPGLHALSHWRERPRTGPLQKLRAALARTRSGVSV